MTTMHHYAFAIAAALLWAASVPVVNRAYRSIPAASAAAHTAAGLLAALLTASVAFAAIVLVGRIEVRPSWPLFLAGVLTYPIATGCYYFGAHLFGGRAEAAAQFARVNRCSASRSHWRSPANGRGGGRSSRAACWRSACS